jgi:hypothetical protein
MTRTERTLTGNSGRKWCRVNQLGEARQGEGAGKTRKQGERETRRFVGRPCSAGIGMLPVVCHTSFFGSGGLPWEQNDGRHPPQG